MATPPTIETGTEFNALDLLLSRRFHGAANVRGVRFQLLYFTLRAFDLYDPEFGATTVIGEGLEDVDLRKVHSSNEYVQVKCFTKPLDWSKVASVITSFLEDANVDGSGCFTLVTNAGFAGEAATLHNQLSGKLTITDQSIRTLPAKVVAKLARLFASANGASAMACSVEKFLCRFRMMRVSEEEIVSRLNAAVIEHWGVTSGNEELFVLALVGELTRRAGNRLEVNRDDMETVRSRVEEHIARGPVNPAIRDLYVSRLEFPVTEQRKPGPYTKLRARSEDYYEGRAARPDHIVANVDIRRPQTVKQIQEVLSRASVCAIVASSGQGKSTLAYRYARDVFPQAGLIKISVCQDDEHVGQIVTFLRARLKIGIPLLVIIDNLGYRTRYWQRVAETMAAEPVYFVVTAREEDWFRYRGNTIGFTWGVVRPQLDFNKASQIYDNLHQRGLIASPVQSAQWAFEQVHQRRLLIEYVYLLTHGRMLAERLEEQVAKLRQPEEDPGKLEAIRLVSVSQRYGAQINFEQLALHASFRGDPQQGIVAILDEYIVSTADGCEGLHPVRSDHLVSILHHPLSITTTINRLISFLDAENLGALIRNALADPLVESGPVLSALVSRCQVDEPALIGTIANACFEAEERRFLARHRASFDRAYKEGGDSLVMAVAMSTLPVDSYSMLDALRNLAEDSIEWTSAVTGIEAYVEEFPKRALDDQFEHMFLQTVLPKVDCTRLAADLVALTEILHRCHYTSVDASTIPTIRLALEASGWQEVILSLPVSTASWLSFAIYRVLPDVHTNWRTSHCKRITGRYKYGTRTFTVDEVKTHGEPTSVMIRFPAEWCEDASQLLSEAAVERLHTLHRFFPQYSLYESYGIHALAEDLVAGFDPTHKALSQENIWQAVDTRKNANWIRLCRETFAADSYSSWLREWESIRCEVHALISKLVSNYSAMMRGQTEGQIARLWKGITFIPLQNRLSHAPIPPVGDRDPHAISKRSRAWSGSVTNFLRQFLTHDPTNGNSDDSRLMRVNLHDATNSLADFDMAVAAAYDLAGVPRQDTQRVNLSAEIADYRLLADMLDYSFGPWRQRAQPGSSLRNPVETIKEWSIRNAQQVLLHADQIAQSLRTQGIHVVVPVSTYKEEYNLKSLVLGVEVTDFRHVLQDTLTVVVAMTEVCPSVDFYYVAALLPGQRYFQKHVLRASKLRVEELLENPVASVGPLMLPVEPPLTMLSLLPSVSSEPLPEYDLFATVVRDCAEIVRYTSILVEGRTCLDTNDLHEALLLEDVEAECKLEISQSSSRLQTQLGELEDFITSDTSRGAWLTFVERCRCAVVSICADPEKWSVEFGPDNDVERLLGLYLNVAYLGLPSELPAL